MAPNARKKRKNPQNLRPATGGEEEQPQQSGSSTKKVRITKNQQNFSPDTEVLPGEEEHKQQQQNGGVPIKKVESLSSSIVFPPPPPLRLRQLPAIAGQESLLRRLGLWDFVNLDLGETIREDLMNELLVNYTYYPEKFTGESRVKDVKISLHRIAVAKALHLPVERAAKGGGFPVSKDESSFLDKFIWGHLVLRDASVVFDSYILGFFEGLKELRLVQADWAGLVWFMMERELLSGKRKNLVKCYYASHLQLVLKHQRPELFDDHHGNEVVTESGNLEGVCQKDTVDSLEHAAKLLLDLQDHYRPEFDFKNVAEKKSGSLAEFSGEEMEMNCLADDAGKEVESATSVDMLVTQEADGENDIHSEKYEVAGKSGTDHAPQAQQQVLKHDDKCQPEGFMLQDCTTAEHSIIFQPPPRQLLDMVAHESLLKRLGLWDFVNLELDETIREDLIKELMVSYEFNARESLVNGVSISLDRTAVVNALRLPAERFVEDSSFPVSEEEGLFLMELFWGHLVLRDGCGDASMMSLMSQTYVLRFAEILKEMRFEEADWAGLVWFMIEWEMLKGQRNNLAKCYYASHLQLVLKHQRPELFDDDDHEDGVVGSTDEYSGIQSVDVSDEDDEHCADLAGREFGGDGQVIEVGNLGVCQSDTVDSLENGVELLLDLQIDLNAEIHSTENEDDLMQNEANEAECDTSIDDASKMHCTKEDSMVLDDSDEGVRNINTDNAFKVHNLKEDYVVQHEGTEPHTGKSADVQIDLNAKIHSTENEDDLMQNEANEAACDTDNAPKVDCMKEDSMVLDDGNEGVCKTSINGALKLHCLKEDYVVQYEGSEAHTNKSADLHFEKKDDAMEDQETEAAFEAIIGNSIDVHCVKDGNENEADNSDLLTIAQDHHQPYVAEDNRGNLADLSGVEMECQEVHMSCMADHTRNNIESAASVDLLVTWEAQDSGMKKEGSFDGLDNQEIENQQNKVNIIENLHQPELELINATEMNGDSIASAAGDAMDCQEVDMSCVPINTGMEVEHGDHDEVVREDTSTDGLVDSQETENQQKKVKITENQYKPELELKTSAEMNGDSIADVAGDELDCNAGMEVESGNCADLLIGSTDVLDTQEIENHPSHLGSCQEYNGNKFNLEISEEEDKHCIQHMKVNITNELIDVEMYHNGGTELGLTQIDEKDDAQKLDKVQNDTYSEKYEVVGRRGTDHAPQTQQDSDKYEVKCVAAGFVLQPCTTAGCSTTADRSFVVPSSYTSEEFAPSVHRNTVGNERGSHVSLRHFGSQTATGLSMDGCNFGANVQSGSMIIGSSDEHSEDLMDLDLCAEQVEIWTAKLTNSAKRKVEENHKSSMMLQKKTEEQNHMIQQYQYMLQMELQQKQQYELMLQKERQQKQRGDLKYERELHLMEKVLEDYRKAIKQTNTSFAKYRERAQLPEEPLYMPHPDGGGDVILVSEWKKLEEERQKTAIVAAMDNFEEVWSAYLEEEIGALNQYCDRLQDLEHEVKTMRGRL